MDEVDRPEKSYEFDKNRKNIFVLFEVLCEFIAVVVVVVVVNDAYIVKNVDVFKRFGVARI